MKRHASHRRTSPPWLALIALAAIAAGCVGTDAGADSEETVQVWQAGGGGPLRLFTIPNTGVWDHPIPPPWLWTPPDDHVVIHRSIVGIDWPGPRGLPVRGYISDPPTSWRPCDAGTVFRPAGEEVSDAWELTATEFAARFRWVDTNPGRTHFIYAWSPPSTSGQQAVSMEWDYTWEHELVLGRFLTTEGQYPQRDRNEIASQRVVYSPDGIPYYERLAVYCVPGTLDPNWELWNPDHRERAYWQGDNPFWAPNEGYQRALEIPRDRYTVVYRDYARAGVWRCRNRSATTAGPDPTLP